MIVRKILNNNLLLAADENGREQIVMGKGLRFLNQVGEELRQEQIQKIFVLQDESAAQRYMQLLQDIPDAFAETLEDAMQLAYEQFPGQAERPAVCHAVRPSGLCGRALP